MFTCNVFEEDDGQGRRDMRRVVMDGTATGVLGALPDFERPKVHVHGVTNTAPSQYIIPRLEIRAVLGAMFNKSGRCQKSDTFTFDLSPMSACQEIHDILLTKGPVTKTRSSVLSQLSSFELLSSPTTLELNCCVGLTALWPRKMLK